MTVDALAWYEGWAYPYEQAGRITVNPGKLLGDRDVHYLDCIEGLMRILLICPHSLITYFKVCYFMNFTSKIFLKVKIKTQSN